MDTSCPSTERRISTTARTTVLPRFTLTEVCTSEDESAMQITLPTAAGKVSYFARATLDAETGFRVDGKPKWMGTRFNLFPVVRDGQGVPWAEAVVYILSKLEGNTSISMATYKGIADDLSAFRRFIDETGIDWTRFGKNRLQKPTYRYNGYLMLAVQAGKVAATTARRRMAAVVSFYRWLIEERVIVSEHSPWKESDRYIDFSNQHGAKVTKRVITTDLSIKVAKVNDPYSDEIDDGGKLRPLPLEEQRWVLDALIAIGNTELKLMHLLALLTGARIQTVLTFRLGHILPERIVSDQDEIRIPVGYGTGIDTKNDKKMVLHLPGPLYRALCAYARSERATSRRQRAKGGDTPEQYLFLSSRGRPLYESKSDSREFDDDNDVRYSKAGQSVRQLITDSVLPYIRKHHNNSFKYRFHDLRASFGMNLTDYQLRRVTLGEITLQEAREYVKVRMGHESSATTDLYLQYRGRLEFNRQVNDSYGEHLGDLIEAACGCNV